jgi:hypothetical protein
MAEATQLVRFVLSIDLDSGCLNTAWHREKNEQEPHNAVPTLSGLRPVVTVIVHIGTINWRLLIVEAVAHKDLGGDRQLFPPKKLLQIAVRIVFLEGMWIFISPCMLVTSIQNPIPCFIHHQHAASCCSSYSQKAQRRLHCLNMLYVERIQQLIMQRPHHRSLGNLVTTGQPPGTSTRESFYGTQNIFHIGAPATSWSASVCHNGPHTTRLWQTTFQRSECPAVWMPSLRIPLGVRRAAAALLRAASPYSNIISVNLSNEYSAFCAIIRYVMRLP